MFKLPEFPNATIAYNEFVGKSRKIIYYGFLAVLFVSVFFMLLSNGKVFDNIAFPFETPVFAPGDMYVDESNHIYLSFGVYNRVFVYDGNGHLLENMGVYVPRSVDMEVVNGKILFSTHEKKKTVDQIIINKGQRTYKLKRIFLFIYYIRFFRLMRT